MKKLFFIVVCLLLLLTACAKNTSHEIEIIIPAGSNEAFVFSDEEISPNGNTITISAGAGIADTEVLLKPVLVTEKTAYSPAYITQGMPVKMKAEKGAWFKIGVAMQNESDHNIAVSLKIEGIDVRIK